MLSFEEALSQIVERVSFLGEVSLSLEESAGSVLAETVASDLDFPPFDTTAMDGWALCADEPSSTLEIAGYFPAGISSTSTLLPGTAVKVMTGAPLPRGTGCVVPVESAHPIEGSRVVIDEPPRRGAHIRKQGEVFRAGEPLLHHGRRLTPGDLVLAAAAGRATLRVCRKARAGVLVTGDEIVSSGSVPGPGQIRNTNGPLLLGAFQRLGAIPIDLGSTGDELEPLIERLSLALSKDLDFLLTTGGVSAGDADRVAEALSSVSSEIVFHKVAMRPAKPLLFATSGKTLIFALPGNPVSAAVAFDLLVRPAWRASSGLSPALPEPLAARVTAWVGNPGPRRAFLPALLAPRDATLWATPIHSKGSHDVRAHASANGYLDLPPATSFNEGELISVYPGGEETTLA